MFLLVAASSVGLAAGDMQAAAAKRVKGEPLPQAEAAGVKVYIARWLDDKDAAISIRFDDSHPSHLEVAVPLLDQCGLVGTFFINPGRDAYKKRRQAWEALAAKRVHEFANHTLHHRGAKSDDEADREIGGCSQYIWGLFPEKSKLLAFRRGGGTNWLQEKPMKHWREKWHLISARYSLSVGTERCKISTQDALVERTEKVIAQKQWISYYYHAIGVERGMSIGAKLFSDNMHYLRGKRKQVWFGGIAQIYKYWIARKAAQVTIQSAGPREVKVYVKCNVDRGLYDQPITLVVELPRSWLAYDVQAFDAQAQSMLVRRDAGERDRRRVLVTVPPTDGAYAVR